MAGGLFYNLLFSMIRDLIIIGSGPAGLTASIYASRYKLSHLVIGKLLGGTITLATKVENYPGFISISGVELAQKMGEQVKSLGTQIIPATVGRIERKDQRFKVISDNGKQEWQAKTLIVATGTERRRLGVPGENRYLGRGISYCTNCDAPFFRDKIVTLVGGSDAAVSGAIHAGEFGNKIYIIYRGEILRAEPTWAEQALSHPKIEVIYKTNILEILGDGTKVTGVKLDNPYKGSEILSTDGVFIEIGGVPGTSLVVPLGVELNPAGFVKVGEDMSTNVAGLFCAGDITTSSSILQQMITAQAQGAIAAASTYKFLKGQKAPQILGIEKRKV